VGEHKEQPVAESPIQHLSLAGLQETFDKIRNVRLYPKIDGYFCTSATRIHCFLKGI